MITAHIGTSQLQLPVEFEFELVKASQLFSFDKLRGDYVPGIEFPDTEVNRNILNHPNRFEMRRGGVKEYEGFELRSDGFLLLRGTLVLDDKFSGYVRGAIGNIRASNEDRLITDFGLPTAQTFTNKASYDPDDDDYCAPTLINTNFFDGISDVKTYEVLLVGADGETYEETILQHYHRNYEFYVNKKTGGLVIIPSDNLPLLNLPENTYIGNTQAVTPMLYVFTAIELLLKSMHFYLKTTQVTDTELKRLCIYNNKSIISLEGHVQGYITTHRKGSQITEYSDLIDYYTQTLSTFDYKDLLPRITLKEFILQIQNLLNIVIVFDDEFHYRIIDREGVFTGGADDIDDYLSGSFIMKGKSDSILKFIMNMDANDALISTYYQDLSERAGDFGDDVEDLATLWGITSPTVGQLRRVISEHTIYEYMPSTRTDKNGVEYTVNLWSPVSIDFQPVKYNTGINKTDTVEITGCGTVPYENIGYVLQQGRFNMRKDTEAGFALRLIFDESGVGKNSSTNYYLNFNTAYTNNLQDKRWSRTSRWISEREGAEAYFMFPVNILANFDINKMKRTRHGLFVPEKMTTKISHRGVGLTKIEGWTK